MAKMKITNKSLKIIAGLLMAAGFILKFIIMDYNDNHPMDPIMYENWVLIGLFMIALLVMMPWVKDKS